MLGTLGEAMSQLRGTHFLEWKLGHCGRPAKMFWGDVKGAFECQC